MGHCDRSIATPQCTIRLGWTIELGLWAQNSPETVLKEPTGQGGDRVVQAQYGLAAQQPDTVFNHAQKDEHWKHLEKTRNSVPLWIDLSTYLGHISGHIQVGKHGLIGIGQVEEVTGLVEHFEQEGATVGDHIEGHRVGQWVRPMDRR